MSRRSSVPHALLASPAAAGKSIWKTAPFGTFADADNQPPCASTIERQIDNPIPMPSGLVVKNASKSRSICAGSNPGPEIRNRDDDTAQLVDRGSDLQPPLAMHGIRHRLDAVHDQIQRHLLKLDPIANDPSWIGLQRSFDPDAITTELGADEDDHLSDHVVDVERDHLGRQLPGLGADAFDDVASAQAISDDARRGLPRLLEFNRSASSQSRQASALVTIAASG